MLQQAVIDYAKGPGLSEQVARDMIEKPVGVAKK
jgi:hypothetical protein